MKKDDIKTLIVVLIICAICVGLVLIINGRKKDNTTKFEDVAEYSTFFSITNFVNSYLNYLSNNDSKAVYSMLYNDYIIENNINENNVLDKLQKYGTDSIISLKVRNMQSININNNYIYYIQGQLLKNTYDNTEKIDDNFKILLLTDYNNITSSIYPLNDEDYQKIINKIKDINIEKNNYNEIKKSELVSNEQICVLYLSDYVNMMISDIDEAYELLSDSMKEKFPDIKSYQTYINNNVNKITTAADKCHVEGSRIYTVIDKNNNKYTFNESSVMNYKVSLSFDEIED